MPLVTVEDLQTELYPEIIDQITRNNEQEVLDQIAAAESFAKGFLFKYDTIALFGTDTQAPTVVDENLKKVIKIIASYWLLRKSSPNSSLDLYREDWQLMIGTKQEPGWLTDVKEGRINPDWPYKPNDPSTEIAEDKQHADVSFSSNRKRQNSF